MASESGAGRKRAKKPSRVVETLLKNLGQDPDVVIPIFDERDYKAERRVAETLPPTSVKIPILTPTGRIDPETENKRDFSAYPHLKDVTDQYAGKSIGIIGGRFGTRPKVKPSSEE